MATQDRLPTGDSTPLDLTAQGGGSHYVEVDDPIGSPDDATTYCSSTVWGDVDNYTFSAFSITSSSIDYVRATARVKGDAMRIQIVVNGTTYQSASTNISNTYTDYTQDWLTNPDTGSAWTEADVEGTGSNPLQKMGIQNRFNDGNGFGITQEYLTVSYTAGGGGGGISIPVVINHLRQQRIL